MGGVIRGDTGAIPPNRLLPAGSIQRNGSEHEVTWTDQYAPFEKPFALQLLSSKTEAVAVSAVIRENPRPIFFRIRKGDFHCRSHIRKQQWPGRSLPGR
jgi:hypothetical protein